MEVDIKEFIEREIPELSEKLYPVFTTRLDCLTIAYTFSLLTGGHVKQSQLELKIISEDYEEAKEMESRLKDLLDMEEDESFRKVGNTYYHSELAGGGVLFNAECKRYEDTLLYIIDWR
ncbi:hypothetical protein [Blautia hansenii]|uniref:hypothetical protein n=1 Tax=Blautia hansenii TaxID=1322 RepID=UPI003983ED99